MRPILPETAPLAEHWKGVIRARRQTFWQIRVSSAASPGRRFEAPEDPEISRKISLRDGKNSL